VECTLAILGKWKGDSEHVQDVIWKAALAWRVVERADHPGKAASRTAPGGKGGQQPPAQKGQRSSDSKIECRVCEGLGDRSYDCPTKGNKKELNLVSNTPVVPEVPQVPLRGKRRASSRAVTVRSNPRALPLLGEVVRREPRLPAASPSGVVPLCLPAGGYLGQRPGPHEVCNARRTEHVFCVTRRSRPSATRSAGTGSMACTI